MSTEEHPGDLASGGVVAFGPFRLDHAQRLLVKHGERVSLGDRAFDVLAVLVRHSPAVVSKAALLAEAWPGVAVEEVTLRTQLHMLRRALGADHDRYIATVSGRGYRFVAPLSRLETPAAGEIDPAGDGAAGSPSASRTNLPHLTHPIVDRERELGELENALRRHRLVTVLGSGGIGKTRLAVELGRRVLAHYPDGVWLVDLAPLSDPALIVSTAATVLNLSGALTAETLARRIANRAMLLILDNCEHLVDAAAALAEVLWAQAGAVTVLATSQESLRLSEEEIYRLEPLALAPVGAEEIAGYGAVVLFVELVRRADPGFALSTRNARSVAEVCRRLDGVPLALEMAAARVRMLGMNGLLAALSERFSLLKRDARRSGDRHASLHHLADWSHGLLGEIDQAVFRRLAIFPGSFDLEAVVAITAPIGLDRWATLDALWRLRDKSLIAVQPGATARYRLLETLRLYALEHLRATGEMDAVAERHALHFTGVFQHAEAMIATMPYLEWIARYRPDTDNLRAALDWVLAQPERREIALSLAAPSLAALDRLSLLVEGRRYGDRAMALIGDDTPPAIEAELRFQTAALWLDSPSPRIEQSLERTAALFRTLENPARLANALSIIGAFHSKYRRDDAAKSAFTEALRVDLGRESLVIKMNLSITLMQMGDFSEARKYLLEVLAGARAHKLRIEWNCLSNISVLEYVSGNFGSAVKWGKQAVDFARETGGGGPLVASLDNLAGFLLAQERLEEARLVVREAFERLDDGARALVGFFETCALLAAFEGRLTDAARIVGYVEAERVRMGRPAAAAGDRLRDALQTRLEAGVAAADLPALKAEAAQWSEADVVRYIDARLLGSHRQQAELGRLPAGLLPNRPAP